MDCSRTMINDRLHINRLFCPLASNPFFSFSDKRPFRPSSLKVFPTQISLSLFVFQGISFAFAFASASEETHFFFTFLFVSVTSLILLGNQILSLHFLTYFTHIGSPFLLLLHLLLWEKLSRPHTTYPKFGFSIWHKIELVNGSDWHCCCWGSSQHTNVARGGCGLGNLIKKNELVAAIWWLK